MNLTKLFDKMIGREPTKSPELTRKLLAKNAKIAEFNVELFLDFKNHHESANTFTNDTIPLGEFWESCYDPEIGTSVYRFLINGAIWEITLKGDYSGIGDRIYIANFIGFLQGYSDGHAKRKKKPHSSSSAGKSAKDSL